MTWAEFQNCFYKNLEDNRVFINSISSQFKYISQYKQELLLDWGTYLKYLLSILFKYNPIRAPT